LDRLCVHQGWCPPKFLHFAFYVVIRSQFPCSRSLATVVLIRAYQSRCLIPTHGSCATTLGHMCYRHDTTQACCLASQSIGRVFPRSLISVTGGIRPVQEMSSIVLFKWQGNDVVDLICIPSSIQKCYRKCCRNCHSLLAVAFGFGPHSQLVLDSRASDILHFRPVQGFRQLTFLSLSKKSATVASSAVGLLRQSHSNLVLSFRGLTSTGCATLS
jgi:hypothetical protein